MRRFPWPSLPLIAALALSVFPAITLPVDPTIANDYYDPSPAMRNRLYQVEKHHLPQAARKLYEGQFRYALGDLLFILRYFPNHPKALELLGQLSLRMNAPQLAEPRFKEAIQYFPAPSNHLVYGIFLHDSSRFGEAIEQYKIALRNKPDYAEAHYQLGLAYVETKEYALANTHAQRAYALGYALPELRRRLEAVGAWQPAE